VTTKPDRENLGEGIGPIDGFTFFELLGLTFRLIHFLLTRSGRFRAAI